MKFAVIGHPVAHSLSPAMHAANFRALGLGHTYVKIDVAPEELPSTVGRFVAEGYRGFNCTIPHKEAVMPLLTRLDDSARLCGAVNTVRIEPNGTMTGFNTDAAGFRASLEGRVTWKGASVLLMGAGGAAKAVAVACLLAGARVTLANRTRAKAETLAAFLQTQLDASVPVVDFAAAHPADCDLVVNATSIGLKPTDAALFPAAAFRSGQVVCDIVPVAHETATLAAARAAGALPVGGLGMLVHQGAEAFRIWTALVPDVAAMFAAITPTHFNV